jgi:pentatricopeptide repeat protein
MRCSLQQQNADVCVSMRQQHDGAPIPHLPLHLYASHCLQNVCIKANELDLAQDVYKQMLAEGCAPNLVTYNILIDVYVKKGQWEEAVKILDTLEQQVIVLVVQHGGWCVLS